MIRYYKLFDLLNRRNMKKTDLLEVVSAPTLAKIGKGKNIQTDAIDKICLFLNCQPGDIMEVIETEFCDEETGTSVYTVTTSDTLSVDDTKFDVSEKEIRSHTFDNDKLEKKIEELKKHNS